MRGTRIGVTAAFLLLSSVAVAVAQDAPPPDTTRRVVAGRVVRPGDHQMVPVGGVWVVLHRIGSDTQGPLDSVRSAPNGRYAFHYRSTGSSDAIYLVSASQGGVAYFSTPLRAQSVTGDDAEITVYDTTSRAHKLTERGRHIVVAAAKPDGMRTLVDVFELSNDTSVTFVAGGGNRPTWEIPLPQGARNFRVGQADIPEGAVRFTGGRVAVYSPFAPGLKQLAISYDLPSSAFPLSLPILEPTQVLEVLVEEPRGTVEGARLAPDNDVSVEGRTFKRYLGHDVPAGSVASVTLPKTAPIAWRSYLPAGIAAAAALMLLVLIGVLARGSRLARATVLPDARRPTPDASERLAREIADLDAAFEREPAPSEAARAAYLEERGALKARLAASLAAGPPQR